MNDGDESLIASQCVEIAVRSLGSSVIGVRRIRKKAVVWRRVCLRITFDYMAGLPERRGGARSRAAREWQPQSRRRHLQPNASPAHACEMLLASRTHGACLRHEGEAFPDVFAMLGGRGERAVHDTTSGQITHARIRSAQIE